MSMYEARYPVLLQKAGVLPDMLPVNARQLVQKFTQVVTILERATPATAQRLLFILVQTDAVICAAIFSLYKDRLQVSDIIPEGTAPVDSAKLDKIKMLALKAKALQLKAKR